MRHAAGREHTAVTYVAIARHQSKNTNTNTKYTCDTGQTRNKLLEQWVHLQNHAAGHSRPGTTRPQQQKSKSNQITSKSHQNQIKQTNKHNIANQSLESKGRQMARSRLRSAQDGQIKRTGLTRIRGHVVVARPPVQCAARRVRVREPYSYGHLSASDGCETPARGWSTQALHPDERARTHGGAMHESDQIANAPARAGDLTA